MDAILRIGAEIADAVTKIALLSQAYNQFADNVRKQMQGVGSEISSQEQFWDSLTRKLFGATTAGGVAAAAIIGAIDMVTDGIQKVIGFVIELGARGSDVVNTKLAFDGLSAGLGAYGKILPEAREKTQGLISDFDMMRAANRAMLFGIDLGVNSFGTLAEGAIRLGRAMGMSATKSLDDLVLAIGRVSPRILDNLGIIVKVGEANKAWAAANDKTVQTMTGQERVLAFQELAMRKIEEKLKNMGPLVLTLADHWTTLTVMIRNWTDRLAVGVAESGVLHAGMKALNETIRNVFGAASGQNIDSIVGLIENLAIWLVKAARAAVDFGGAAYQEFSELALLGAKLTQGVLQLVEGFLQGHKAFSGLAAAANPFSKATQEADQRVQGLLDSVAGLRLQQEEHVKSLMSAKRGQDAWGVALRFTSDSLTEVERQMEAARGTRVKYTAATQQNTKDTEEDNSASERAAKLKEQLSQRIQDMSHKLGDLAMTEENIAMVTKEYGNQIGHLVAQARLSGIEIPENVEKWAEAVRNAKLDEAIRKVGDDMRAASIKMFGEMVKDAEKAAKDQGKTFDHLKDVHAEVTAQIRGIRKTGLEKELADLEAKHQEEIHKLGAVPNEYKKAYEHARFLVSAQSQLRVQDMEKDMQAEIDKLGIVPEGYDEKYEEAVNAVKLKYQMMKDAEMQRRQTEINGLGRTPEEYEQAYGDAAGALDTQLQLMTQMVKDEERKKLEAMRKTWSVDFLNVIQAVPNIIQQAFTGGGGWEGATKALASKIGETFGGRVISGALTNVVNKFSSGLSGMFGTSFVSALGTAIPGIGAAIGAVAGPLLDKVIGWFKGKPEHEKIMEDAGRRFGMKMSEGLAKQIEKDSKDIFSKNNYAAMIFNLDKIISEAGGLTSKNYESFLGKLRDVFTMMQQGKMTMDQARETMDKNFGAFAKHLVDSGKQASDQFLNLIRLHQQSGMQSAEVAKFVEERSSTAAKGLAALLAPIMTVYGTLGTELDKAKTKVQELETAGKKGSKEHSTAVEELNKLLAKQQEGIAANGEEIDRVGRLTLATFNAQIAAGVGWIQAINNAGPALDNIITLQKSLGMENSNAAVQELIRFRNLTQQNKELVEAVAGLNDTMLAMQHIGALNADTLADLEAQGLSMYGKLTNAGFTEQEALRQMKGWLEQVIESHRNLGIPVDANTQKLIDQARAQGILKAEGMSTNDILVQGISALIEAVGGKLPEAFRRMRDSAVDATNTGRHNMDGLSGSANNARYYVDTVAGAADHVRNQLNQTPWEQYGQRGYTSGYLVNTQLYGTGSALDTVGRKLDDSADDFERWAEEARREAERVRREIDGISFGESPGGIKEWAIKLSESIRMFREWRRNSVYDLSQVRREIDDLGFGSTASLQASVLSSPGPSIGASTIIQNVNIDAKGSWIENQETLARWGSKAGSALADQYFGKVRVPAVGNTNDTY